MELEIPKLSSSEEYEIDFYAQTGEDQEADLVQDESLHLYENSSDAGQALTELVGETEKSEESKELEESEESGESEESSITFSSSSDDEVKPRIMGKDLYLQITKSRPCLILFGFTLDLITCAAVLYGLISLLLGVNEGCAGSNDRVTLESCVDTALMSSAGVKIYPATILNALTSIFLLAKTVAPAYFTNPRSVLDTTALVLSGFILIGKFLTTFFTLMMLPNSMKNFMKVGEFHQSMKDGMGLFLTGQAFLYLLVIFYAILKK